MFYIGGEPELQQDKYNKELTNSGRSSLRLIIESANLAGKHILLPNFLCQIIIDIFQEYQITYSTYIITDSFEFELPESIDTYDALYLIKYFGSKTDSFITACNLFDGCLIIDDVFSPFPEVLIREECWYSYNSLRKISPIADLSFVYSNAPLIPVNEKKLISFSTIKYQAKHKKFDYLHANLGDEQQYLALFSEAEDILDYSKNIYSPSNDSLLLCLQYFSKLEIEKSIRESNYKLVKNLLAELVIPVYSEFYSFAPILLDNRDQVRAKLRAENIYLAVHWPAGSVDSILNQKIISLPVDSRYTQFELEKMCSLILNFGGE